MHVLVTGAAGFIGYHTALQFCRDGHSVVGIDNLNSYYDPDLKKARLQQLKKVAGFRFVQMDCEDAPGLNALFAEEQFSHVVHLAAQAGVRHSIQNPGAYVQSNLVGFGNILEACRNHKAQHLVYASSSSVYGLNTAMPFSTAHAVDHPVSLYAATKKSNEMMAHAYSHLYQLPTTGLRFFTVYGPWGRPDMALFIFTQAILQGKPIPVFNEGRMQRDFTYIDDIAEGVTAIAAQTAAPSPDWSPAAPDPATSAAPFRLYNIGNNQPVELLHFIHILEESLGAKATLDLLPMQPGDVVATYADIAPLRSAIGFTPKTPLKEGVARFVDWYRSYYTA